MAAVASGKRNRATVRLALAATLLSAGLGVVAAPASAAPAGTAGTADTAGTAGTADTVPHDAALSVAPGGHAVVTGPGGVAGAAAAVRAAGGTVLDELPLVSGVAADLPAGARVPGYVVAADRSLTVASTKESGQKTQPDDTATDLAADAPQSTARATLGLDDASPSGRGVTVAVVDTGVADSPDLAGRVLHVDVSGNRIRTGSDAGRNAGTGDDYGHGTFVAGLIAGDGHSSGGRYEGAAPGARLLDVRVAADDGSTSLITVIRGLQVVSASADALDIRVLNLSLSSGSPLPYQLDPLTQALEALWRQGVTVVTAAGNDGPTPGSVSSPGLDPMLLTAGALDEAGTADRTDDSVADYSSRGSAGVAKPDLVAPGSHLVSLRAPGSQVDDQNPASRIGTTYFRGSGTSMSTALVSGVVADVLSARPNLTPDQVKALLAGTAYSAAGLTDPTAAGAGGVDAAGALAAPTPVVSAPDDDTPDPSTLPAAQVRVWDHFAQALLDGDRSAADAAWKQLSPSARSWVARSWVALSPEARSWVARSWVGRSWVGADGTADEWLARSWAARSWVARSWVARSWVARSWVARSWVARSWVAGSWAGRSWVGRSWVDDDWASTSGPDAWAARSWVARSWVDDEWAARSWVARSWTARSWTSVSWS